MAQTACFDLRKSYSENSTTFFKIFFVHDRFVNLMVIIKRTKWRERKTYRIQYAMIISMKNGRSFHGRGMQTNHVQASSLSPLSHPSCNRYLRTRVPQVWFTREPCAEFAPWHWEKLLRAPLTFTSYDYQDTHFQVSDYSSSTPNDIY